MKEKNKGGRPKKTMSEKRTYQICLKLKTSEEYSLRALCKNASMSKQEYILSCIANSNVLQRITPEINQFIRCLCGMANNLNQIARRANQAGYTDARTEYLFLAEKIDNIINMINHDWKNNNK